MKMKIVEDSNVDFIRQQKMGSIENMAEIAKNNNNITDDLLLKDSGVLSFYSGTTVFVTGGTGFLGKAIIEKLVRTCEEIEAIYVLMRPKFGKSVEERYKDFMKNMIFDKIKSKNPELLEKVKALQGDVSEPNIGLSQEDQDFLSEKVNIVIHSAATVRFVEPMTDAINLNTLGTKRLLELSYKFKNLKSIVHVSTAYCNPELENVEEKVYISKHDPNGLLQSVQSLPIDAINAMSATLQGNHPNTYTYTKNLAETIVLQNVSKLPICIVRPSIVTGAYSEPYPGWIDNLYGVTGIAMEIYRGSYRSSVSKKHKIMDIIPVDFVVNTCIAAAWHHRLIKDKELTVYNCTTGDAQKMTWNDFVQECIELGRTDPSKYIMRYPNFTLTSSHLVNKFWDVVTHFVPAFLLDLWLRVCGKKPMAMKMTKKIQMATKTGEFFSTHEWKFKTDNFTSLNQALALTGENAYLPCDITIYNWKEYMRTYILGIRKFLLRDSLDSLPSARQKLQKLYVMHKVIQFMSGYFIFNFLFKRK